MQLAKVIGSVVSTQKHESLIGMKLMIVQYVDNEKNGLNDFEVAADTVGAGVGDYVLLTRGSSARHIFENLERMAVDCAIIGIIDSFES